MNYELVVKSSHVLNDANGSKHKDRCDQEVDLMTNKIGHVNIVRGLRVNPDTFLSELLKASPSTATILITEYCEGGDLRRQLNDNRNISGMLESEVRNILLSLKNAVFYLHSLSIIHRDIKPENIVFHLNADGKRIYKV